MNRIRFTTTALAAALLAAPAFAVDITPPNSTSTRLSVTGFVQAFGTYYFNASQGLMGSIGTDDRSNPSNQFTDTIRTSRLTFNTITPNVDLGDITTSIEFDLAKGSGTDFHLRQAYGTWGNFTLGQTWSNWVDGDAAADEVDWFGPIGQASYDTPRLPLAAYKFVLNKENSIILSLEHNGGADDGANWNTPADNTTTPPTPATPTASSSFPNIVGVYQYYDKWGHIALRALAQGYGAYVNGSDGNTVSGTGATRKITKWGTAIQLSGQLNCFGLDLERDSLVYNVYTGSGLGEYGIGLQAAQYAAGTQTISLYKNTGWTVGYTHTWDLKYRSNIVLSGVNFQNDSSIVQDSDIKSQNDFQVNTFVKLTKTAELGVEYMYETLKTFGSAAVTKSDGSTSNKNTSSKVEIELKYSF